MLSSEDHSKDVLPSPKECKELLVSRTPCKDNPAAKRVRLSAYYSAHLRIQLDLRVLGSRVGWEGKQGVVQGHLRVGHHGRVLDHSWSRILIEDGISYCLKVKYYNTVFMMYAVPPAAL